MPIPQCLQDWRFRLWLGLAICMLVALSFSLLQAGGGLSRKMLDWQFELRQKLAPEPTRDDVVIVGIDRDSFNKFNEPVELWHPHLSRFLQAMQAAKPGVLGIDLALPESSYPFMPPRYEEEMVKALTALNVQTPVVLARKPDDEGLLRQVAGVLAASVADAPAPATLCLDVDGVFRHFDLNRCTVNAQGTSFAEKIAARLGVAHPGRGVVDFSAGRKFDYIPFTRVLAWQEKADKQRLQEAFSGKTILLGDVSARAEKVRVPLSMAIWMPMEKRVPEVLVQAQILRSMTGNGLIRELPPWGSASLALLGALLWLGRAGRIKLVACVVALVLCGLLAIGLLGRGIYLPLGDILLSGLFAFMARVGYESVLQIRDRKGLRNIFASYVNREAASGIVRDKVVACANGERVRVCLLLARIRDFEQRVQAGDPQASVLLLNDYLAEMAIAIRQHKGTLDKFAGSELLAFFGAPQPLESPERKALEAAQEMLLRQRDLNRRLQEGGLPPIEIEIALHAGQVVVGQVGPAMRKEYAALGSEVEVVKTLVEWVKNSGVPVVCTAQVAEAVELSAGISEIGEKLPGDVNYPVYGWLPPLLGRT